MGLESDDQRKVLDIVARLRKCGLESVLSLPQLVVCGDQSAGKSSVLEALTEIPFPRNDNLCTRFATEIILRRASTNSLSIKVIPDPGRPAHDRETISKFNEMITDFNQLPNLMAKATKVMGLDATADTNRPRAFAKDTLSIEIEGPQRPQLTLVDLPGIIQAETKDASQEDVALVSAITEHYISQSRTICLAVISATHDYANQSILNKVRTFDPNGERTLGIITKPDRLSSGSGAENAFIELAKNEDVFFKLGWHVLKNRSFEQSSCSFVERNASEASFFRKSNFNILPPETVGIHNLSSRLSRLLFDHVRQELPKLREDLETGLRDIRGDLAVMGLSRIDILECKTYLTQLSQDFSDVCKAAVGGHYEGSYFTQSNEQVAFAKPSASVRRLRAVIQRVNQGFSDTLRLRGHKFNVKQFQNTEKQGQGDKSGSIFDNYMFNVKKFGGTENRSQVDHPDPVWDFNIPLSNPTGGEKTNHFKTPFPVINLPTKMSNDEALVWVRERIIQARGRELPGNFNPLVIGELFWEQSSRWHEIAVKHVDQVRDICYRFLSELLREKSPADIYSRLWPRVEDELASRYRNALEELRRLEEDIKNYPINYNHYYTDTIQKRVNRRRKKDLKTCVEKATHVDDHACRSGHTTTSIDVDKALDLYSQPVDPDSDKHSCEEVLDCLYAIYKVTTYLYLYPGNG